MPRLHTLPLLMTLLLLPAVPAVAQSAAPAPAARPAPAAPLPAWEQLSEAQRDALRERWSQMTPEQRKDWVRDNPPPAKPR